MLDEPTEGLDPIVQEGFYELVRERRERRLDHALLVARPQRGRDTVRARRHVRNGRMITVRVLAELQAARPRLVRIEFAEREAAAAFELDGALRRELDGSLLVLEYEGEPRRARARASRPSASSTS